MPRLTSISCDNGVVTASNGQKTWTLTEAMIPAQQNTPAKVEAWANNWLAANVTECQVLIHVFSLAPLKMTVWTGTLGALVPVDWWG